MSNSDLDQMRHLANGLRGAGPFEFFSCALAEGRQQFGHQVSGKALEQIRPVHLRQRGARESAAADTEGPMQLVQTLRRCFGTLIQHDPLKTIRVFRWILINSAYWKRRRREAERFIQDNNIDSVITCNDTTLYYLPILQAAKNLGRTVILARSANIFFHDTSDGYRKSVKHLMRARMPQMRLDSADCLGRALADCFVRRLFPEQIAETNWGSVLPYQSTDILSLAVAGIRPKQLWHLGQDWTDFLIVSGDDEIQALKLYGVPDARICPIGCVAFENAVALLNRRDELRAEICLELDLDPHRPIVLFTIPAGWEHRTFTYAQQFGFLRDFFTACSGFDAQFVVSLHPLSKRLDYEELAAEFSLRFLERPLIDSIVIADIFLGADNSSVLRWAMAVGIPTMNFQFNPDAVDIDLHPEYPNVADRTEFCAWLAKELARSPVPTSDLLVPRRRPMGLVANGQFFHRLAEILLLRTKRRLPA